VTERRRYVRLACCLVCGDPVRGVTQEGQLHDGHHSSRRCGGDAPDARQEWQWQSFDRQDETEGTIVAIVERLDEIGG